MDLEHSFTVPVGVDDAWNVLLDIERIAPCMPGAALDTVDGDEFTGTVKVKLGPISLTYKGKAGFVEKDATAHRAVIEARGRDARGNGTANATITATLSGEGGSTTVHVLTALDITGKPAQFGRGVMADVGNKLIGQFADNLAAQIAAGDAAGAPAPAEPAAGTSADGGSGAGAPSEQPPPAAPRPVPNVEPINLVQSAGPAVAKRLAPVVAAVVALLLLLRRRRRH